MRAFVILAALTIAATLAPLPGRAYGHAAQTAKVSFEIRSLNKVQSDKDRNARYRLSVSTGPGGDVFSFTDMKTGKALANAMPMINSSPLIVGTKDIASARAIQRGSRRPVLAITMTPGAMKTFAAFTKVHLREVVAVVVNGKLITAPAILEPITGGELELTGNFKDLAEVEAIAAGLNGH